MLIPLLIVAWIALLLLFTAVCRMAARGDRGAIRKTDAAPRTVDAEFRHVVELTLGDARVTGHGAQARAARSATGS